MGQRYRKRTARVFALLTELTCTVRGKPVMSLIRVPISQIDSTNQDLRWEGNENNWDGMAPDRDRAN